MVTIEVGKPEADRFCFPMLITCQGKSYKHDWKYSDRKIAQDLWNTREYFQGVSVFQLAGRQNVHFELTGCNVTHHGVNKNRFFSFQKVEIFQEIINFDIIDSEIEQIYDQENWEEREVKWIKFFANHPLFVESKTGMELLPVPGSCFEMGCGNWAYNCKKDEKPVHNVCVNSFYMAKYETTQTQWQTIMDNNPSYFPKCGTNCPVENITWNEIQNFIELLNKKNEYKDFRFRLPTEAEWEYACRSGGKNELYCGSNELKVLGWYKDISRGKSHPVGMKKPNSLGLYDMSGNVYEFCMDGYFENAYRYHKNKNPLYLDNYSNMRIIRGGSWGNHAHTSQSVSRFRFMLDAGHEVMGFRLVFSPLY